MTTASSLAGRRVLVTGGAGLIGSHVTERLLGEGVAEVVVFDNLSRGRLENVAEARRSSRVTVAEADVRDRTALGRSLAGIDVLIHLAAIRLTHCAEDPRLALEVMVDGTFNVLEAAVGAGVRRVIAASSASIYGMAERFPTDETHHPYHNRTLYGAAKTFSEGLLASFADMYGLPYIALRPFNVYGPRMDIHGAYTEVLIRWMERIESGQPPVIFGDGAQSMDFVFVDDVARAFVTAAASAVSGAVFNIGSGVETSLTQLATTLLRVMGSSLPIEHGPVRALTAVPRRVADTRQARERLGFEARVGLEDGLQRLVRWWRHERQRDAGARPARA